MILSGRQLDDTAPWWRDHLSCLQRIDGAAITDCATLNALLPAGLETLSGHPVRFVPSTELGDTPYEYRIHTTGRVSTRPDSWHDLFNALAWMRFPRIKAVMNALHYRAWGEQQYGRRGKLRDALTLFDECGVLVFSARRDLLEALARRRWRDAFTDRDFSNAVHVSVCGHAMLEKYLEPYRSMTAKALFVHVGADFGELSRDAMLRALDETVSRQMLAGTALTEPACLSPLPLAGIPGWWAANEQASPAFLEDKAVFRPPPQKLAPVPVLGL